MELDKGKSIGDVLQSGQKKKKKNHFTSHSVGCLD